MTDIDKRDCENGWVDKEQNLADFTIESLRQALADSDNLEEQLMFRIQDQEAEIATLKQQLAECQQKLEMAEAVIAGDGALITGLKNDLAEYQKQHELVTSWLNPTRKQLLECQAREKVLRDAVKDYHQFRPTDISVKALAMPSDSTALDTMKKQWQRERTLEAAEYAQQQSIDAKVAFGDYARGCENEAASIAIALSRMAKELE
jgi:DNA repair exonuclease SbcCD ATPase subunit